MVANIAVFHAAATAGRSWLQLTEVILNRDAIVGVHAGTVGLDDVRHEVHGGLNAVFQGVTL